MREFKVNNFITLKLEGEKSIIYVNGECFKQCKYILINIPIEDILSLNEINSVDEAVERINSSLRPIDSSDTYYENVLPEDEFWAHCSNLQTWSEHDYDTRLLHSNLAFPLLKKLTDIGDLMAKKVFKEEIAKRIESGYLPTFKYLWNEGYIEYLSDDEILSLSSIILPEEIITIRELEITLKKKVVLVDDIEKEDYAQVMFSIRHHRITDLFIYNNPELKIFPESICKLEALETLIMHENFFTSIPNSINRLKSLKKLDLKANLLTTIPEAIGNLKSLKEMNLSSNLISFLPYSIGNLISLEILNLGRNKLKKLPFSLGKLKLLKKLNLYFNYLQRFPSSIKNLQLLEDLNLINNRLKKLSNTIINLKSLKSLLINGNNLEYISNFIMDINKLNYLQIDINQAKYFSKLFKKLKEKGITIEIQ